MDEQIRSQPGPNNTRKRWVLATDFGNDLKCKADFIKYFKEQRKYSTLKC